MSAKDIAIDAPRPQICMWKLSLAHWPEYLCEAGLVAFFVLADCLITIAVKYPGSPVHSWFLDPLGQRVVIGLGLGTATLLLIKSPLGEASGAQRHELLIGGADPNLVQVWHVSHHSGSAAGRVADRPLQPVVRRPCALGVVGRHAWPSPTLRIQRIR